MNGLPNIDPPRALTAEETAIKVMTATLVDAVGGNGAAAAILGVSRPLVSKWCHPRIPEGEKQPSFMPIQHIMELERKAACGVFSRWMTEVAETDPTTQFEPYSEAALAKVAVVTAEATLTHARAVADGTIDACDRKELRTAFVNMIGVCTRLIRKLDRA